jgi:coenzyme F420-reducing hydrogenase delta subunit
LKWVQRGFSSLDVGNTVAFWVLQRVEGVKRVLSQIGLEPERLQTFNLRATEGDTAEALDNFTEQIGGLCLASVIKQEVKS